MVESQGALFDVFICRQPIPMMMILYLRNFLILKELQPVLTVIGKIIQTNLLNTLFHHMHLSSLIMTY